MSQTSTMVVEEDVRQPEVAVGDPVPPQLTDEAPDRGEHVIGHVARIDPVEGLARRWLRRRGRSRSARPSATARRAGVRTPTDSRGEGDERFVLHGALQRRERSLVAEVAGEEAAVEAEQQIGAALVGAERLDEQLASRPSSTPK